MDNLFVIGILYQLETAPLTIKNSLMLEILEMVKITILVIIINHSNSSYERYNLMK